MHKHGKPSVVPQYHTNAFVDLDGIPYLLAEYLDRRTIQQIDRSLIKSEIFIDTRESMRAIIDISIDDIGRRASDGYPAVRGNNSKQKDLLNMTTQMAEQLNHQFDVIRKGIVMRVNYQLENQRNGQVLRSMTEDLFIKDRQYFLEINSNNIDDNAVITNFSNSMVSTINEFTHGRDPMVLRITSVNMFYTTLRRDPGIPRIQQATGPWNGYPELDYYNYHEQMQKHHIFAPNGCHYEGYGQEPPTAIAPPTWTMFSRYYHFDRDGHDIVLHDQEIYDRNQSPILVPCGTITVNRAFMINPGHRIIFKFSIWKNDVTVVSDAQPLAYAIQAPYMNVYQPKPEEPPYGTVPAYIDHRHSWETPVPPLPGPYLHGEDPVLKELQKNQKINAQQNEMINKLAGAVNSLIEIISQNHEGTETPEKVPEIKAPEKPPHHDHKPPVSETEPVDPVLEQLASLQKTLEELKEQNANDTSEGCDHTEIDKQITDLQTELEDIRTNGTDEAVAERLTALAEQIAAIKESVDSHDHPQPIPEEKVNELLDKIENS